MPGFTPSQGVPELGSSKKRVRFGGVTYVTIPPRRSRILDYLEISQDALLGGPQDDEARLEPPLGALSQLPFSQFAEVDLLSPLALSASPSSIATLGSESSLSYTPPRDKTPSADVEDMVTPHSGYTHKRPRSHETSPVRDAFLQSTPDAPASVSLTGPDEASAARRPAERCDSPQSPSPKDEPPAVARRLDVAGSETEKPEEVRTLNVSLLQCAFCGMKWDCGAATLDNPRASPLPPHWTSSDGITCHTGCALWCPEVFYDVTQGSLCHLGEALARARRAVCEHCQAPGAAIQCAAPGCARHYHLPCAIKAGTAMAQQDYTLWCPQHRLQGSSDKVTDLIVSMQ